jgi:hypothetical protein
VRMRVPLFLPLGLALAASIAFMALAATGY